MRKYTATAVVSIAAGALLGLTGKQASARAHQLKPVEVDKKTGDGTYQVLSPTQFKIGEQFTTDLELNKAMAAVLEPVEVTREKERDKAKAAAATKDLAAARARIKELEDALEAARAEFDTKALDAEIEQLRAKAALYESLPEDVRVAAEKAAADAAATKAKAK
jgi:ATPase subunit of ABC transporter with duplicated ATPase domains